MKPEEKTANSTTKPLQAKLDKLRSKRRDRARSKRSAVWLHRKASGDLDYLRDFYQWATGKQPSTSLVMRRALALAADHVHGIVASGDNNRAVNEGSMLLWRCR